MTHHSLLRVMGKVYVNCHKDINMIEVRSLWLMGEKAFFQSKLGQQIEISFQIILFDVVSQLLFQVTF